MSLWGEWLREGAEVVDARLPAWAYASVSVDVEAVRADLRARGLPFVDPLAPGARASDIEATARQVVASARGSASSLGAIGGLGGLLSMGPEAAGWVVLVLRLAQRLAIVHGFDPDTERGRVAVERALAAAFELDLPGPGLLRSRASELLRPGLRAGLDDRSRLARGVVKGAAGLVTARLGRLVPVVSSAVSALDNRAQLAAAGERMVAALRELADGPLLDREAAVDAVEVPADRR